MKHLTKITKVSFVLAALLTVNLAFSQFTRQQAIDLILNDVLSEEMDNIDVYSSYNSLTVDVNLIDNETVINPYTESWGFFINDNPFASWYHSCRYIWVSSANGDYTITNVEIYPKGLSSDYEEISLADRPDPVAMDGTAFVPDPQKVESNYNDLMIKTKRKNA